MKVAGEQARGRVVPHVHYSDGALLAVLAAVAVGVHQLDVVQRRWLARGAGDGLEPLEVGQHHRAFALAKALVQLQAGQIQPLLVDLGV